MMLESVGFRVDYNQLRRLLGTSELGTPHSRIQRLSHLYLDLNLIYRVGDLGDIVSCIDSGHPVWLFVNTKDLPYWGEISGHAVLIVGYSEQYFYLNDPKFSNTPQIVSHGDLVLAWESYDFFFAVVQRNQKPR